MPFRPKLIPTIATLIVCPALAALGFWQLDRAAQKRQAAALFEQSQQAAPIAITHALQGFADQYFWQPVAGNGTYLEPTVLLDNRTRNGAVGYDVISPLKTTDGQIVLVNRGWIASTGDRSHIPVIAPLTKEISYSGYLAPPPSSGISLNSTAHEIERLNKDVIRIQAIEFASLSEQLQLPLLNGLVYLDDNAPHGFSREWPKPGFRPEKHQAYATQWFAMAIIVAGLFVGLNYRRAAARKDAL